MSKVKGQNLRVFIGEDVVAEATSCQISLTNNMEDTSTKDTVGKFSAETIATKSWQVTVDTINVSNLATWLTAWKDSTELALSWDLTSSTDNETPLLDALTRGGTAIITDCSIQFNDRQTVTTNITFTGTGEIS